MNNEPLVSIIVPCYKVEQYLPNCIESILSQSYTNWELILVDDGSPDNCGNICDDYAVKDNRIKVVHKQNGGLSSARNAGMKVMNGEYVTFLDSDDFLHKDALHILVNQANKYDAQIVQCDFVRGSETVFPNWNNQEKLMYTTTILCLLSLQLKSLCGENCISVNYWMVLQCQKV